MSTPRQPNRLRPYSTSETFYPRELAEVDGILKFVNDDGSVSDLNAYGNTTIKDGSSNTIGTVNPKTGGSITIPNATTTKRGLVILGSSTPKAAGTAAVGTDTDVARADHVHPLQTTVSGNAGSATKLETARTIDISGVTATGASFDGSANATIAITAIPATIITGLADVATSGSYDDLADTPTLSAVATSGSYTDLSNKPTIPSASTTTPSALGTAAVGTATTWARADHVHAKPTSVSGNAGTASKLAAEVSIGLSGVTATAQDFDGSSDIVIPITAIPATIITGLAAVAKSGDYNDLSNKPSIPSASSDAPKAAGTAAVGTGTTWARADHVHPAQTSISGNAATATKLVTARTIGLSGVTATAQSFNGTENITIPISAVPASIVTGLAAVAKSGAYSDLSGTPVIPIASTATPKSAGTAAIGTSEDYARADHVHPLQTTVSGNAGTATKLATARTIGLSGAVTGTATSFNGSQNITIPVTAIDGSMITGTIPLSSIPKGAQERLIIVANDEARLSTDLDAQNGDVIKVEDTGIMYYIVDDTKLGTESAFSVFTAGAASSVAWSGITGKPTFATVATSGSYNDLSNKPSIPSASSTTPKAAGTAAIGTGTTWARADHVHPLQTTVSGNAGTATKLATARTIGLSGVTATAQSFNGSANITIPITAIPASIVTGLADVATSGLYSDLSGTPALATVATSGKYTDLTSIPEFADVATSGSYNDLEDTPTIPAASSSDPKAAGTASAGTGTTWARADHVHPLQTTVSGNAGSATKLATARTIGLSGVTATAKSFNGTEDITIPITAVPASIVTGLAAVATSGAYSDLSGLPTIPVASTSSQTPKAAGTAAIGTSTNYARADHVHPAQTTVSGNAGSATKLANSRTITVSGVTATGASFNGTANATIEITAVPASIITGLADVATSGDYTDLSNTPALATVATSGAYGDLSGTPTLATVATSGSYNDLSNRPTIPTASTSTPLVAGTASYGSGTSYARSNHVHPLQTTVSGNAGSATKLATARTITVSGVTATGASFDGSANATIAITAIPASIVTGLATVATSGSYNDLTGTPSIPAASSSNPKAAGTASAGTETTWARADHVHPLQTTVSGNAGTATKLATARTIGLSGVTAEAQSFNGSANITIPITAVPASIVTGLAAVATSGDYADLTGTIPHPDITMGTNSTSTASSLNAAGTFTAIDSITKDADGHVTAVNTKTITMPDTSRHGFAYATCSTAAATTAKTAALSSGTFSRRPNGFVAVRFTYAVPAGATLNVASTGAVTIYHNGSTLKAGVINAGDTAVFTYNESYYYLVSVSSPSKTYTTSVTTTWSGSAAPYTQTITISGITANDTPIVDVVPDSTYDTAVSQIAEYGKIYKITTAANSITVYATEKTEIAVPIQLKCVK